MITLLVAISLLGAPPADSDGIELFEKSIRPILAGRCGSCHSGRAREIKGDLRLDSAPGMLRGGSRGPAIVPGDPAGSLLVQALKGVHRELKMPPDGSLSPTEIGDIELWIRLGAPDPRTSEPPRVEAEHATTPSIDIEKARAFWSFRPIRDPPVPDAPRGERIASPIDRFVAARRHEQGFRAARRADRRVLIRRATYDLTGLPPSPEEVDDFLADRAPGSYSRLLDRLLASWHHGERWGRHWLDLVRYADTSGCNADVPVPPAYRYRNWVIRSFNADLPYDRFVREQIAGDLLRHESLEDRFDGIVATGYLAISRRFSSLAEEFHLTIDDTIDNVSKVFSGLTLSCARCHEHKFDPLSMNDYYALYGIFQSTRYSFPGTEIPRHSRDMIPLVGERELDRLRPFLERLRKFDREIDAIYANKVSLDIGKEKDRVTKEWKDAVVERDAMLKNGPVFPRAFGASEGDVADARIQIKGDPKNLGHTIPRGFPAVLGGMRVPPEETGSGRRQLARWLADEKNPLTARVMVNRIWHHHFGYGLVRTPDDFGARGARPTHPDLLDWLASRFMESGWSIKTMHRLIMESETYRMASDEDDDGLVRDPDNRWLWRFNSRRLSAEELRDSLLAVSGALDRSMGGEHPFEPEWRWRYTQHKPLEGNVPALESSAWASYLRVLLSSNDFAFVE